MPFPGDKTLNKQDVKDQTPIVEQCKEAIAKAQILFSYTPMTTKNQKYPKTSPLTPM
jgi:hypothetical protein